MTASRDADELRRIERFAKREGPRFGLAMVIHADGVLAGEDRRRLADELRAQGKRVAQLELHYDDDALNLVGRLTELSDGVDVLFVDGLDRLAIDAYGSERRTTALLNLNLRRDDLPKLLNARVVFWVTARGHSSLRNQAGDLCRVMLTTAELHARRKPTAPAPRREPLPAWYRLAPDAEREQLEQQLANFTTLFETATDGRSRADLAASASRLAIALGRLSEALEWLMRAIAADEECGLLGDAAGHARRIVEIELFRGRLDAARHWVERASALAQRGDDVRGRALARALEVELRGRDGKTTEALEQLEREVLPPLIELGLPRDQAAVLDKQADVLAARDELEHALALRRERIEPLLDLAAEIDDVDAERRANLRSIGDLELRLGNLDAAARVAEVLSDDELLDAIAQARGETLRPKPLPTSTPLDARDRARMLGERATLLRRQGSPETAIVLRREEIAIHEALEDVRSSLLGMGEIVELELELGQWAEARLVAERMLAQARQLADGELVTRAEQLVDLARAQRVRDEPEYVFVVHDDRDKRAVMRLSLDLLAQGVRPWVDVWDLLPGADWARRRDEALLRAPAVLVCEGPHGAGRMDDVLRARIEREPGSVVHVVLPGAKSPTSGAIVVTHASRSRDVAALAQRLGPSSTRERWLELEARALEVGERELVPFRGLASHRERDARWMFGREAEVDQLLARLATQTFTVVVGSSGSGKSSLVLAGVCPMLRNGALEQRRELAILRPTRAPCHELARVLAALGMSCTVEAMRESSEALRACTKGRALVLVVDQLEELFTVARRHDEGEAAAFVRNLVHATREDAALRVIATLRADFLGEALAEPELGAVLRDGMFPLPAALDAPRLRAMIELPLLRVGHGVEAGLCDHLIEQVVARPGQLPLLQHVLVELWQRRDTEQRLLTQAAYDQLGGFDSVLAQTAERALEELHTLLGEQAEPLTHRLLTRLLIVGETAASDARRRVPRAELVVDAATEQVVEELVRARVLIGESEGEQDVLELAHEAISRSWPRLVRWLEADRAALRVRDELESAAAVWRGRREDAEYLWGPGRIEEAKRVLSASTIEMSAEARAFMRASEAKARWRAVRRWGVAALVLAMLVAVAVVIIEGKSEEAVNAQRLAEADQKSRGLAQESEAIQKSHRAKLMAEKHESYTDAAMLAIEAARGFEPERLPAPVYEGIVAVLGMLPVVEVARFDERNVQSLALSDDGKKLAVVTWDGVKIGNARKPGGLRPVDGQANGVGSPVFSPDGQRIAAIRAGELRVWDTARGEELLVDQPSGELGFSLWDGSYSENGKFFAARGQKLVAVWNADTWEISKIIHLPERWRAFESFALTKEGDRVVALHRFGFEPTEMLVWDVGTGDVLVDREWVGQVALSPSGESVVANLERGLSLVSTKTGAAISRLWGNCEPWRIGFDDSGKWVFVDCRDDDDEYVILGAQRVRGAKPSSRRYHAELPSARGTDLGQWQFFMHGDGYGSIWMAPDDANPQVRHDHEEVSSVQGHVVAAAKRGKWIAAGDAGGVHVYAVRDRRSLFRYRHNRRDVAAEIGASLALSNSESIAVDEERFAEVYPGGVRIYSRAMGSQLAMLSGSFGAKLSISGAQLFVADRTGLLSIWNLSNPSFPRREFAFNAGSSNLRNGSFSPDARLYATPTAEHGIRVWDIQARENLILEGHESEVDILEFSPDGRRLASGDDTGSVRLWDLASNTTQFVIQAHTGEVRDMQFSADGKYLATSGDVLHVWDARDGSNLAKLRPYGDALRVVFNHDATRLAAVTEEGTQIWEIPSGRLLGTLETKPTKLAFVRNGTHLATADDKEAALWPMPEVALALLCRDIRAAHRYGEVANVCDPATATLPEK